MKRVVQVLLLGAVVAICGACNPTPPRRELDPKDSWKENGATAPLAKEAFGVGDVEAALRLDGRISDKSKAPNVNEDATIDKRERLVMTAVNVTPPAPKELWVTFKLWSNIPFPEGPAAIRVKILRDKTEIGSFSAVMGKEANKNPVEQEIDVLSGLASAPATMLISAQAEVILLPSETDPSTVDPKAATGSPETTGNVLGNPMRIDFAAGA